MLGFIIAAAAVGLGLAVVVGLKRLDALLSGKFGAGEYARLYAANGWGRYGLPAAIPANAREVRIFAPAAAPSLLPAPDQYVEVRYVLPRAEASAALAAARIAGAGIDTDRLPRYDFLISRLETADDEDPESPLPGAFVSLIIANPGGSNVGGVSVNAETGEVVYWIFES